MLAITEKANQALTKRHNARLVLKAIYDHEPISRATIARATSLTATTVSHVIGELLAEGLVAEAGAATSERGKPPKLISLRPNARQIIALDLAQNHFHGGVLNLRGELLSRQTTVAEGLQGEAALHTVFRMVEALISEVDRPLLGIGVGAPGIINLEEGVIRRAVNLGWHELPLAQLLADRYATPVHVLNDNQAALLAEHFFGQYKHLSDLIVIRVGRGVGAGIMLNGALIRNEGVGEIGHVRVEEGGELCSCGQHGCLETIASRRAILRQAQRLAAAHPDSLLAQLSAHAELDIQMVDKALSAGDLFLLPLIHRVGDALGVSITQLVSSLGARTIFLCGSVTGLGAPLLERIRTQVYTHSLTAQLYSPAIDLVSLETDIIMLGATALLLQQELGLF